MNVTITELEQVAKTILADMGYESHDAQLICNVLLYAQKRCNNQGFVKLITGGIGPNQAKAAPEIVKQTPVSALVSGHGTQAMVAMHECIELAKQKASDSLIGLVGLRDTTLSTGAIGYYVRQLAENGLIGIMVSSAPNYVAIHGGRTPVFGTNPIAFGIPGDKPLVFDMATAAISYYGVRQAETAGQVLPEGVASDTEGHITTNPSEALKGAIRAFGGHKGSGLALMVEILAGPLIEAGFCGLGERDQYGQLIIAIDPNIFTTAENFQKEVDALKAHLKQSPKLAGVDDIILPGESGDAHAETALETGQISMDPVIWEKLKAAASQPHSQD